MQLILRLGVALIATTVATPPVSAAKLLTIDHNGTSGDEGNPFDSKVLNGGADWTFAADGSRSVMTALDNATGGNNRLIVVDADDVTEFSASGGPADKGWVFEIELEILQGEAKAGGGSAYFGVRSENEAGKQAWIALSEVGGADDKGQIGFVTGSTSNFVGTPADLDVDSLIGDGQYHNFRIHKYDKAGTTTSLENVPGGSDFLRFFAVIEKEAP